MTQPIPPGQPPGPQPTPIDPPPAESPPLREDPDALPPTVPVEEPLQSPDDMPRAPDKMAAHPVSMLARWGQSAPIFSDRKLRGDVDPPLPGSSSL